MSSAGRASGGVLLTAGVVDSFGLSLGWTTFTLLAVMQGGLPLAGLYNAAMFVGIGFSAPVTGWLAGRMNGRLLLGWTGAIELVLRLATMMALLARCAPTLVAAGIVSMNVMAWVAYAGMRAEVAAVEPGTRSLTRYAMAIAAIEALGAAVAALLPLSSGGRVNAPVVAAIVAVYCASLIPQFACARRAQVQRGCRLTAADRAAARTRRASATPTLHLFLHRNRGPSVPVPIIARALVAGGAVMLVASGPASLGVALAAELYGHLAVVASAIVFTVGCLLAPLAARQLDRLRLPPNIAWPLLGVGMLSGWIGAPWQVAGLLAAQFLSGLSMTVFQGEMDARIAAHAETGRVTSALAWGAASRATGSAVAVRLIPLLVAARSIGVLSLGALAVLVVGALVVRAATTGPPLARAAGSPPMMDHRVVPAAGPAVRDGLR
jgi:hypothetical protein